MIPVKSRARRLSILIALTALVGTVNRMPAQTQGTVLAIVNVTVIDGTGAAAQPDSTVLIRGDKIVQVGPAKQVQVPRGARVIRGEGKYLIPGLWDAHVHWYNRELLPLFTANGVTGIRIMWGSPLHQTWARDVEVGHLSGPRIYMAGSIIDGPRPIWPNSTAVTSEAEARKAVTDTKAMGGDFVKVYSRLTRESFFTIAEEAKKRGIPFAGHVPGSVTVREASDAGQKTIEHQTGMLMASSSREEELRNLGRGREITPALIRELNVGTAESFDPARARELAAHLSKNGTWQSPTLTVLRNMAYLSDPAITGDARLKYMPESIRKQWDPKNDFRLQSRTAEDLEIAKRVYAKNKELTGILARAGVGTLAGTDVLNPYCFPGFSLHDELVLLVEAGLTPMQALQAATLNVAKMMGREAQLGTLEAGKLADAVLLDANPLTDVRNTTRIRAVIANGRVSDRAALDKMLAQAEAAARK